MTRHQPLDADHIATIVEDRGVTGPRVGPVLLVVGGQSGSAQAGALEYIAVSRFGAETTQIADMDSCEPDCREALVDHAMARQANIVLRVENYDEIGKWILKATGDPRYGHVELTVLATNDGVSWASTVLDRDGSTEHELDARRANHDADYAKWAQAIADSQSMKWFDRVCVADADGRIVYENTLVGEAERHWETRFSAELALLLARSNRSTGGDRRRYDDLDLFAVDAKRRTDPDDLPPIVLPLYRGVRALAGRPWQRAKRKAAHAF